MMKKLFSLVLALTTATTLAFAENFDCGAKVKFSASNKTGYHFVEWQKGGSTVSTSATFTINEISASDAGAYTAIFAADEYAITYKDKGNVAFTGSTTGLPTKHTYGTATTLVNSSKTGYDFGGWFTNSNCTGTALSTLGATDYTAAITLYAKWDAQSYNISYKDQGNVTFSGSNLSSLPATHTYGTATTLVDATKDGYDFGGWFTTSDCSGTAVTSLGATTYTNDVTLYAKWTPKNYTINYKDQGDANFSGTHATGYPTTHTYGTATTLLGATKTGYDFGGWYTNAACTGSAVTALGATAYTDNITLYAKWNIQSYQINFYTDEIANGGELIGSGTFSKLYNYNDDVTAPQCGIDFPVKTQTDEWTYSFNGWSPTLNAKAEGAVTYIAQWSATKRQYTVTFNNYDGSLIQEQSVNYGVAPEAPTPTKTPSETGKTFVFAGWTSDGGTTVYATGSIPAITGAITYTAHYTESTNSYLIQVFVDAAGGGSVNINGGGTSGTFSYSTTTTQTINAIPADDCHEFVQWNDGDTNATRNIYVTGAADYTATFQVIKYTITAEPDDTTHGTVTVEVAP